MAAAQQGVIERSLRAVGTLSLLALMGIVFVDVVGRNLFNSPLLWGTEVAEVLLALMVFVFYPVLARRNGHIVVDLIPVPKALTLFQRLLAAAVGASLFGLIAWCCGRQAPERYGWASSSGSVRRSSSTGWGGVMVMPVRPPRRASRWWRCCRRC